MIMARRLGGFHCELPPKTSLECGTASANPFDVHTCEMLPAVR